MEEVNPDSRQPAAPVHSVITVHARHTECCHDTLQTHFQLPVPLSVTQSFTNSTGSFHTTHLHCSCTPDLLFNSPLLPPLSAVTVRWQLHFVFLSTKVSARDMTLSTPTLDLSGLQAELRRGLQPVGVDTMTWDLPLTILPTVPSLAEGRTASQTLAL